jgi:hypothetical protein
MGVLSKIFGGKQGDAPPPDEPLVPVPIPALGVLLLNLEKKKGEALTEAEVLDARDKAVCMMMRLSQKQALDEKRGYSDINPENAWAEWLVFREEMKRGET